MSETDPAADIRSRLRSLLPLYGEQLSLPETFRLQVPYVPQDKDYYCGAACIQMIAEYFGRDVPSQHDIMDALCQNDYTKIRHETFEVLLSDYLASRLQVLPSHYSPAIHIAPKIRDGIVATDFIRGKPQVQHIIQHDIYVFKRLLIALHAPLVVRVHYTTDMYPMDDDVARYLDVSGHALLIVGFNRDGFLVHDPWNPSRFGGKLGGQYQVLPFEDLWRQVVVFVNCSLDDSGCPSEVMFHFEHLTKAIYPGREIEGQLAVRWPGIDGVAARRWVIDELEIKLSSSNQNISFAEGEISVTGLDLRPGTTRHVPYTVRIGQQLGSYQIAASMDARLTCPHFPWVKGHRPVDTTVKSKASYRISVQDTDWFHQYAMT